MKNKNAAHLAELKLTPRFYRDQHNTICLLIHEEDVVVVARGVSVCSPKDQFVKLTGRNKALGQALRAVAHKANRGRLPYKLFTEGQTTFGYKACYVPSCLYPSELEIVERFRSRLCQTHEDQ